MPAKEPYEKYFIRFGEETYADALRSSDGYDDEGEALDAARAIVMDEMDEGANGNTVIEVFVVASSYTAMGRDLLCE